MYVRNILFFSLIRIFTHQSSEHKKDTDDDESFDCSQSFCLWNISGDGVENVDQNQKDRDQQGHPGNGEISDIQIVKG